MDHEEWASLTLPRPVTPDALREAFQRLLLNGRCESCDRPGTLRVELNERQRLWVWCRECGH